MTHEVWVRLQAELSAWPTNEPFDATSGLRLAQAECFEDVLASVIGFYLNWGRFDAQLFNSLRNMLQVSEEIIHAAAADLMATLERDPACASLVEALLFRKGYQALTSYRIAHAALAGGSTQLSRVIQHRCSCVLGVDIHPRAEIGGGVVLDHGTGIVVGETARIESDCYLFHGVTLGSTGSGSGKRHPTIRRGVFLGAGATVLGDVEISEGAVVAAGSVVVRSVPAGRLVGGVPAKDLGEAPLLLPPRPRGCA